MDLEAICGLRKNLLQYFVRQLRLAGIRRGENRCNHRIAVLAFEYPPKLTKYYSGQMSLYWLKRLREARFLQMKNVIVATEPPATATPMKRSHWPRGLNAVTSRKVSKKYSE